MERRRAETFIRHLYETELYRQPDPEGFKAWVAEAEKYDESQESLSELRQRFLEAARPEIESRKAAGEWPGYERAVKVRAEITPEGERRKVKVIPTPEEELKRLEAEREKALRDLIAQQEAYARKVQEQIKASQKELAEMRKKAEGTEKEKMETKRQQVFMARRKKRTGKFFKGIPWGTVLLSILGGGETAATKKTLIGE